MYQYTFLQWVFIFYVYCVFGWIFETTVVSVEEHHFVDRGFLMGPMLPIYGFGAVIMLHVSLPLTGHPVQIFFSGMVVATVFEYIVGVSMEKIFKVRYWDYSERPFNFQGQICLRSSIAWGALSLVLPYWMHRPVEWMVQVLPPIALTVITVCVTGWFVYDVYASTRTALDLAQVIEEIDKMREEAAVLRRQLEQNAAETRDKLAVLRDDAIARAKDDALRRGLLVGDDMTPEVRAEIEQAGEAARQRALIASEERRLQLHLALATAEDQMRDKVRSIRSARRVLRGNPTLRSVRFGSAVKEIRRMVRSERTK